MLLLSRGHVLRSPLLSSFASAHRNLLGYLHFLGSVLYSLDDIHIAGAAAQIARDAHTDFMFCRASIALQTSQARHHHAWGTVPTLQSMLLLKTFLQWMQFVVLFQALDTHNLPSIRRRGEHLAR